MYLFLLPIGDWAEDGHGRHHNTVVRADKAIEDVQIAYNQICNNWHLLSFVLDFFMLIKNTQQTGFILCL